MARFDLIAVYMLANHKGGTIYTGMSSDLSWRLYQHRSGEGALFTRKYRTFRLVWFERHEEMATAVQQERRLKEWQRQWKIDLIEASNPEWRDLSAELM